MNGPIKKGLLWGVLTISIIITIRFFLNLLGGFPNYGAGPYHHPIGRGHSAFEHQHLMHGPHHGGGFLWIGFFVFLIVGLTVAFLLVKWLRKQGKDRSFQQFIMETSISDLYASINNRNTDLLDEWEKNQTNKKENKYNGNF